MLMWAQFANGNSEKVIMKKQKKFIFATSIILLFGFFCLTTVEAQNYGLDTAAQEAELPKVTSLTTYAGNIIGAGLSMVSVVFFVLMLYAGIRWMIARGNEEEETKARDMIIAAVIGMVIIMASYALTTFVFRGSTGGQVPKVTPTATQPQTSLPPKATPPTIGPKCTVKEGVTKVCQDKIVSAWVASHPDDAGKPNILGLVSEPFMIAECKKQEDTCEMSTIGLCVSLGGSYCQSPNQINNETNCKEAFEICEWK